MVVLQVSHVAVLVAAQIVDNLCVSKQALDLLCLLSVDLPSLESLLALFGVLGGRLVQVVELRVQVANIVGHVGLLEQRIFELGDVRNIFVLGALFLLEVEQREDEVAVQVRDEFGQQAVGSGHVAVGVCHVCGGRCR